MAKDTNNADMLMNDLSAAMDSFRRAELDRFVAIDAFLSVYKEDNRTSETDYHALECVLDLYEDHERAAGTGDHGYMFPRCAFPKDLLVYKLRAFPEIERSLENLVSVGALTEKDGALTFPHELG